MKEATLTEIREWIQDAKFATQHVLEHYDELLARCACYTRYGKLGNGLVDILSPSKYMAPKGARTLTKSTRKTDYVAYDFDENFRMLCTREVSEGYYGSKCPHFYIGDTQYAALFYEPNGKLFYSKSYVIRYANNRPILYIVCDKSVMYVHCYEYMEPGLMHVTSYYVYLKAKELHGVTLNWDAPIGAPNSPVQVQQWAEEPQDTDLSKWFK